MMMKAILMVVCGSLLVSATGCASVYTNIEKTSDNQYLMTRVKQGFFTVSGTLYSCQAAGDTKLKCKEVGAP
jgi:hypothetical protein